MTRVVIVLATLFAGSAGTQVVPGHRLPPGPERPVRERQVDLTEIHADLRFDMEKGEVAGTLTARFTPLRPDTREVDFDAAELAIDSVESVEPAGAAAHMLADQRLRVTLPRALGPQESGTIRIAYHCRPRSGLYFYPATGARAAQM